MEEKLTILIVDDELTNRMILQRMFQDEYRIVEADNGVSAFQVLEEDEKIDIILLDIIMPEMNGIEFLEKMKSYGKYGKIPVIINTSLGDTESERMMLELGADEYITKPYNPDIIHKRVNNIVKHYIHEKEIVMRKLQETSERLDTLIDVLPGGIGMFEINNEIKNIYFNDGLCELLGYQRGDFSELSKMEAEDLIYEEDRSLVWRKIKDSIRENSVLKVGIRLKKKTGSLIWVSVSAKVMRHENNRCVFNAVFTDMTEEKRVEGELNDSLKRFKYQAERDSLTGIYNREKFYYETKKMLQENSRDQYVIAVWNIDRFKLINDLYGNTAGDNVLKGFARFLSRLFVGHGTFGRTEADHFVACTSKCFLLSHMDEIEAYLVISDEKFGISQPIMLHAGFYEVEDVSMPVNLMCDRANIALNTIKGNYMQRYVYYDASLREMMLTEQRLTSDIESALKEGQFFINIQPIVEAETGIMVSGEALVRWKHSEYGIVSPGMFVPLFEKNGFVKKLDMYVLEKVCEFLKRNQEMGIQNVPVSVNLSQIDFYDPDLCRNIMKILDRYQIDTSLIKLEITESAYTSNPKALLSMLNQFHDEGFKVLMDDFGSGYSSLNTLKDIPVDILKIDMKFIDNLETSERAYNILYSIVHMGKSLEMGIVAEGIETQSQSDMLAGMSCDYIQGYYYSKPLDPEDYRKKLTETTKVNLAQRRRKRKKPLVIVIDDEEINRESIRVTIEDHFQVLTASGGKEGLELLKRHISDVSLVVTDIAMPELDGFELLEIMNKSVMLYKIPVLVITSFGESENVAKALEMGAIDVINKPIEPKILRQRIYNIMQITQGAIHKGTDKLSQEFNTV